jgi:hypothetical protein
MHDQFHTLYMYSVKDVVSVIRDLYQAVLCSDHWTTAEARRALHEITFEMLTAYVRNFYNGMFVEGLVEGNLYPKVRPLRTMAFILVGEDCINRVTTDVVVQVMKW